MSGTSNEARIFDEDALFDELIITAEQDYIAELETDRRIGAGVEIDLQDHGPLYLYVLDRRAAAAEAIKRLIESDPEDAVNIALAQAEVREYRNASTFILRKLASADAAESEVNQILTARDNEGDIHAEE